MSYSLWVQLGQMGSGCSLCVSTYGDSYFLLPHGVFQDISIVQVWPPVCVLLDACVPTDGLRAVRPPILLVSSLFFDLTSHISDSCPVWCCNSSLEHFLPSSPPWNLDLLSVICCVTKHSKTCWSKTMLTHGDPAGWQSWLGSAREFCAHLGSLRALLKAS